MFLEYRQAEVLVFDNGRLKQATYDTAQGFGLRAVKDEAVGYAHASDVSEAALARAAEAVRAVKGGHSGRYAEPPGRTNRKLYGDENPLGAAGLRRQGETAGSDRRLCPRQGSARAAGDRVSVAATWQVVEILRADGETYRDIRPLVRLNVSVVVGDGDRQETGSYGVGGREGYQRFIETHAWQQRGRRGACARRWSISTRWPRRPARWTWCWARAGPASCCTRRSATASKATSTARRPPPLPA